MDEILKHFDKAVEGLDPLTKFLVWIFAGMGSVLICLVLLFIVFALSVVILKLLQLALSTVF